MSSDKRWREWDAYPERGHLTDVGDDLGLPPKTLKEIAANKVHVIEIGALKEKDEEIERLRGIEHEFRMLQARNDRRRAKNTTVEEIRSYLSFKDQMQSVDGALALRGNVRAQELFKKYDGVNVAAILLQLCDSFLTEKRET